MEGSDYLASMGQNSVHKTPREKRVPKVGERVVFRKNSYGWQECTVTEIALDRYNEPSSVKLEWRNWFGFKREEWEWIGDLHYLATSKPD